MLKNYFKIGARNLRRHKGYTFINITGLAVGMACCLLILLFVQDELSYDRFHEKADRIYRVTWNAGDFHKSATVPASMVSRFREDFSQVEAATHLFRQRLVIRHKEELVEEARFYYADEAFFEVFTFPLIAGNPKTALRQPNTVVLTASTAQRYFGDQDPLGKTLTLNDGTDLRVTGVVQDVPANSHFTFEALVSLITLTEAEGLPSFKKKLGFQGWQYLLLTESDAAAAVDARLDEITDRGFESMKAYFGWSLMNSSFDLQALTRIHLYSNLAGEAQPNSDVRYLYIFSLIAVFILLLACINYTNLTTARSVSRGKEVGVRKVIGAQQGQLARQFLSEALVLSLAALVLAVGLVEALLPVFNELVGKSFALTYAPATLGLLVAIALVVGLLAGSYPALFLARLEPIRMLRGGTGVHSGSWLRKGLVTFQFTISIVLIISTLVVQHQLSYLQNKRLGYDTEQILQVPLRSHLASQAETFKTELSRLPGVVKASLASGLPGRSGFLTTYDHDGEAHQVRFLSGDSDYLATMGMTLVEGRNFDPARPADTSAFLINAYGARRFGLTDKLGQAGNAFWGAATTPIGIVSDFHTASLREPLMPTVILMDASLYRTVVLRLQAGRVAETLAALETTWQRFVPNEPFRYLFLDAILADQYRAEQRLGRIFIAFSLLAVLIACLGLFGLAAYTAEQRTKEIGIRKVLGATVTNLVTLLSKDFIVLVVVGTLIAAPVAYLAMQRWLEAFAYHIELSWWIFLGAGLIALVIAVLTVSYQAIKAALADPVKALRYE